MSQARMVPPMVKDRRTYQGVPGYIGTIRVTPKGGIRLVFSECDDVIYTV
jgi:hypothetical protein